MTVPNHANIPTRRLPAGIAAGCRGAWRGGIGIAWGAWLLFSVLGAHAIDVPLGSVTVELQDVTPSVQVLFRTMRLNRAIDAWNVEMTVTNSGSSRIPAPLVAVVDTVAGTSGLVGADGALGGKAFLDLTRLVPGGSLGPGQGTPPLTLTLGRVGNATPKMTFRILGRPPPSADLALGLARALNEVGQPLPAATVSESGPLGTRTYDVDPYSAVVTVGQGPGHHRWQFDRPGYLPVWREADLVAGSVTTLPHPRLTPRSSAPLTLSPLGGTLSNDSGSIRIVVAPASLQQAATQAALTPLTAQTLAAFLPGGWSPAQAFWFEISATPSLPPQARVMPWGNIAGPGPGAWVRWDPGTWSWQVLQVLDSIPEGDVTGELPLAGAYALVVPDRPPLAPPLPVVGQALQPSTVALSIQGTLSGAGTVDPPSSPSSRIPGLVTATASLALTNESGNLPSGFALRCDILESYRLRNGEQRHPPQYENYIVGYQRPGDSLASTLESRFPLRPQLLFGPEELDSGSVKARVLTPEPFAGAVLSPSGGLVVNGPVRILAGRGDFSRDVAVELRLLSTSAFADFTNALLGVEAAFEITLAGLAPGRGLDLQVADLPTNALHVLARVVYEQGQYGVQPVLRLASDSGGRLLSQEPATGPRLPGLASAGQYLLLRAGVPHGVVTGVARDGGGHPAPGLPVRVVGTRWLTFSATDGSYALVAPVGKTELETVDPVTGYTGVGSAQVADPAQPVSADLALAPLGPRVVGVSPADGATDVPRVAPISLTFSRALDRARFGNSVVTLSDTNGAGVAASLTLNLAGTVVTLLPSSQLAPGTLYRIAVSTNLADAGGLPLAGVTQFSFTTETDLLNRQLGQLVIYEPTNGLAAMTGAAGFADPSSPVILVNDTTGFTATVLSRTDGSFSNSIPAAVDDYLSVVVQNRNGTRTTIPASRQLFRDGSVGLFAGGGVAEFGPADAPLRVVVEPGAVTGRTRLKLELEPASQVVARLGGQPPAQGRVLTGLKYSESGDALTAAADVSVPVAVADLKLPPGLAPERAAFGLMIPHVFDGVAVYELIDTMSFEADGPGRGRLVTHSPPFPGLLASRIAQLRLDASRVDTASAAVVSAAPKPGIPVEVGMSVVSLEVDKSDGVQIAGQVVSARLAANGAVVPPTKPVAGAVVMLDFGQESRPPGLPRPGEMIVTSGLDGSFAFFLPPREDAQGRVAMASHPRFPFQKARSPVGLPQGQTSVSRLQLLFQEGVAPAAGTVTGVADPQVHISHFPPLPAVGTGPADHATISVEAEDDVEVTTPVVTVLSAETQDGQPLNAASLVHLTAGAEVRASVSKTIRQFEVRADAAAKVRVQISVADETGISFDYDYALTFGLSASGTPKDPNDKTAPYVLFSWPPNGAGGIPSLEPILLRFSEVMDPTMFEPANLSSWITFDRSHSLRYLDPSPDGREARLYYDGALGGKVRLTVSVGARDQNGNVLDQDPSTASADPYVLEFDQAGQRAGTLPGGTLGGGAVVRGRFAYALDRLGPDDGTLLSYDLEDPTQPTLADRFKLHAWPTTLSLIPDYAMPTVQVSAGGQLTATGTDTNSYVAVFTGAANEAKRLVLVPARGDLPGLFDPRPVSGVISRSDSSQVVKSRWDPPFLGYFELGADVTSVALLDLTAFRIGATLSAADRDRLPRDGSPGTDANADGDYADLAAGDLPPSPLIDSLHPLGFSFSYAPIDPHERIQDFDFLGGLGLVAVVSAYNDGSGRSQFQVVLAAQETRSLNNAVVAFAPGKLPKRVVLLDGVELQTGQGLEFRDLALVSLQAVGGGDGSIAVIDVSQPAVPVALAEVPLPRGQGTPQSLLRREDGLLSVGTTTGLLLLDPRRVLLVPLPGQSHPAFVGSVNVAVGGVRDFATDPSGINVVNQGGVHRVVQTDPRLQVVTFGRDPFSPDSMANRSAGELNALLAEARPVSTIELAATDQDGEVVADLAPERHHYVLVDAPGAAADSAGKLPLAVVAINERGELYARNAGNAVPAVLGDSSVHDALFVKQLFKLVPAIANSLSPGEVTSEELSTLQMLESLFSSERVRKLVPKLQEFATLWASYPLDFNARRLSDDPTSPLYNKFLAGPFEVLPNSPGKGLLDAVINQATQRVLDRRYLRASPRLWVGFPRDLGGNAVLGGYASQFKLNPRITVSGFSLPFLSNFGQQLVTFLAGSSSITGPALLATLDIVITRFAPPLARFIKTDFDPTLLPGAAALYPVGYRDRPLLFVPGFGGSRLSDPQGEFWPNLLRMRTDPGALAVAPSGAPLTNAVATDALRHVLELGVIDLANIYGVFITHLRDELGYVEYDYFNPAVAGDPMKRIQAERRRFGGSPQLGQIPLPELFVFSYDWRLDNEKAADLLQEYVDLVRYYHPDADGVDLIAHSNGNLVSRRYTLKHPGLVKRYVSIGAPWLGSGKPIVGMLTGDMEDVTLNFAAPISDLRRAAQFMPGFHQLIINKGLFDLGLTPLIEAGYDLNQNGKAYESYTYPQFADAMENFLFRDTHAEVGFTGPSPSRRNHEAFQQPPGLPIADWSRDTGDVEVHHIIGMQSVARSVVGVRLWGRLHQARTNVQDLLLDIPYLSLSDSEDGPDPARKAGHPDGSLGITTNQFRFRPDLEVLKTLGDGTVPLASLARGFGSGLDFNSAHAKLYAVVSQGPGFDEDAGHNPMLNNPLVFDWVDRILQGRKVKRLEMAGARLGPVGEGALITINATATSPDPSIAGASTTLADFGDGGFSSVVGSVGTPASFSHAYRQNGVYVVGVGSTTTEDVSGFATFTVEVTNVPPKVTIQGSATVNAGETTFFKCRVEDPGSDDTHTFVWALDGAELFGQHAFAAAFSLSALGNHTLEVKATDSDGGVGTDRFTFKVVTPPPVPPLSPPSPLPGLAAPAPIFSAQPEVFVRITGHASGPGDTKGLTVRELGQLDYFVERYDSFVSGLVPAAGPLIAPLQGPLGQIARVGRRLKTAVIDAVVQRSAQETSTLDLFQTVSTSGGQGVLSTVEFDALGGPLEVEIQYREGGVPVQFTSFSTNLPPVLGGALLQPSSIDVRWPPAPGLPGYGASLKVLGTVIPPVTNFSGLAAADRLPPAVVAFHNPANGLVTVLACDNFTPTNRIDLFLVQDASGDGRLEDEVFHRLATNVLDIARLPTRKFAIVARDLAGNVSPLDDFVIHTVGDYTFANTGPGGYCDKLTAIRTAIRSAVQDSMNEPAVRDLFLLDPSHLWMFEQGSGACLWKQPMCEECNGNFIPGQSDNDYQLFFPVRLDPLADPLSATERAEWLAANPFSTASLEGDWYFKPPLGLDASGTPTDVRANVVTWEYDLPSGFQTPSGDTFLLMPRIPTGTDLSQGFDTPLVPAEIISRTFTHVVTNTPAYAEWLSQTTFFPVRREHFMYGALDLELPPEDGSDPIADSGCGRQMLLLKWVLEGAYVDVPPGLGLNQGVPSLDLVYSRLASYGIPAAEGYEWGLLQEFSALNGGVRVDVHASYGASPNKQTAHSAAGSDLEEAQRKKLKKMGKAAIRGALARIAGDPQIGSQIFGINRQSYQQLGLKSFEDFILRFLQESNLMTTVFGPYGTDRPPSEGPDLFDFLKAKKGADDRFFEEIFRDPEGYARFVRGGFDFLRNLVEADTEPGYTNYLAHLVVARRFEELAQRFRNEELLLEGSPTRKGLNQLRQDHPSAGVHYVFAVRNYGDGPASGVAVNVTHPPPPPGPGIPPPSGGALDPGSSGAVLTADIGSTLVDGTPVTQSGDAAGAPDDAPADNALEVTVVSVPGTAASPVVRRVPPLLTLHLDSPTGPLLTDHEAIPGVQLASPGRYIREGQPIFCQLIGAAGAPPGLFKVDLSTPTTPNPVTVTLSPLPGNPNLYASPPIVIGPGQPLSVVDEEPLTVVLKSGSVIADTRQVMVDLAEVAAGGIDIFYKNIAQAQVLTSTHDENGFAVVSDQTFRDNATAIPPNTFPTFLVNGGTRPSGRGEADFLYITAHGDTDGSFYDHVGGLLYNPNTSLQFPFAGHPDQWGRDMEWAMFDACNTLSFLSPTTGRQIWQAALNGNRPSHGVLGAYKPVAGDLRDHIRRLWSQLHSRSSFVGGYEWAMENGTIGGARAPQAWAWVAWEANVRDTLEEVTPDVDGPQHPQAFDFAPLSLLTTCVGGKAALPGTGEGTATATAARVPARLPSSLRLQDEDPLRRVAGGRYQAGAPGDPSRRSFGATRERRARSGLTETTARQTVGAYLRSQLPALEPRLVEQGCAPRVSGRILPDGSVEQWTNGYLARFVAVLDGVQVWGDDLHVSLLADHVAEVSGTIHRPDPTATPAVAEPVVPLARATAAAAQRLLPAQAGWEVGDARLVYVQAGLVGAPHRDALDYLPAWRLEFHAPETGTVVQPPPVTLWVHATSGAVLPGIQ